MLDAEDNLAWRLQSRLLSRLTMLTSSRPETSVLQRLREDRPLAAVELRPPRIGLSATASMELWIDMYHSIQRLARRDTIMFLTDNAVGLSEEENLAHLTANLAGDVDPRHIVPFLTSKHSVEYIPWSTA
jgi:hypothetical protein